MTVAAFCPLIKEDCKTSKCVMWKIHICVIVSYLENAAQSPI